MELEELIGKAKKGDREALIRLVMERRDEYYRLAYTYAGNREDSLDAMQDMIVILFEHIKKLKEPQAFYSWSKTILVNCCRSILRRRKRTVPMEMDEEPEEPQNLRTSEIKRDILSCLGSLNMNQQEAIRLKYFMDLDYETIAKLTNTPVGTVKSRVFNGLAKMRDLLGGEYL